jgi:hypothetical protein
MTIDRWSSRQAYESFQTANSREYNALDTACAALTQDELCLVAFEAVGRDGG